MDHLPRGTVTFLFTDIEGSTALLKRLGERYGEVLETQRRILRTAAEAHDGREVDNQGDSFFIAFARASAAVGAAVAAQRALAAHEWPEGAEVRVRMGLHTGEPAVGEERYVGLGVHRAARIGSVAHGGQVLLSNATRELVGDDDEGVVVRELGSYRLKDIDRPERLFQLDIDGLQTEFPPLKAERAVEPRPLRRRAILLSALAGVVAAAIAVPIFAFGQGGGGEAANAASGDALAFYDRSGRLVANAGVGATPANIAVGAGAIWVTNTDDGTVSKIDPVTKREVDTIPVGSGPIGIAVGNGFVWVANSLDGTVSWIDPKVDRVVQPIAVGNGPLGIAYGGGSVWVANTGDGSITKIDAATGTVRKTLKIPATELAFGAGSLWASQREENQVVRIDPKSGSVVQPIHVGNGPTGIAVGNGAAWVANSLDGTVTRIDAETNSVVATIPVGDGPTGVADDKRGVWVSNQFDGTLVRIDPRTNRARKAVRVGDRPQGVATSGSDLLVALRQPGATHRGGTLILREPGGHDALDSIDTAVAYAPDSWQILRMTGDGLVAYNQVSGLPGTQLVPDLAVSLPAPTEGGRTYAFRLRPGIRYSNGRPVKASDFRDTIERDFKVGSLPASYYESIVGGANCRKRPKRCDLSRGIVTDDATRTVVFHLTAPDPEFLYKLALPFAYVVPAGTPPHDIGTHPLPSTGPYAIATYQPKHLLKLARNRYFHEWSKAAQPDGYVNEIVLRLSGTVDRAIADVIGGKADMLFLSQPLSPAQLTALATRHASQVHVNPQPGTNGLFLNTRVSPFNRVEVRRALNYAVDRTAGVQTFGGPDAARPTCQTLPPDFPGYRPHCPYTAAPASQGTWTAPNLAKARALVARSGTRGTKVTVWSWSAAPGIGPLAARALRTLGYRVSLKPVGDNYFQLIGDSRTKAQIGFYGWGADYPAASSFFGPMFRCTSYVPGNGAQSTNASEFCDPRIDREIARAARVQGVNPSAAPALWARVDRDVTDAAPWVPLYTANRVNVLSKRIGNYRYSPPYGMLLDQLWVR